MAKKLAKRKVCFPIMSRVHYARQKQLLDLLKQNSKTELQLVVGGSVLLDKYGEHFLPAIAKAGFTVNETLYNVVDGGNHVTMAKTAGLTALEFTNSLFKLNPDVVLIRGDRFEQLALAMVAAYLNKTIAHIEGGDLTGTIDESVRHAITKLSHFHFVTNEDSRRRVIRMGENPRSVFNVGSLDVEFAAKIDPKLDGRAVNRTGMGALINVKKPFLVVMQHPVTTEKNNRRNMELTLKAVDELNLPTVVFWPNSDAGTNDVAKAIRVYREHGKIKNKAIRFVTDLLPEDCLALLRGASLLVGNSSAGIKECSYFGTPVVNVGTRQANRLHGPNVVDAAYDAAAIRKAAEKQLAHGRYPKSDIYYKPNTSRKIVEVLSKVNLKPQKRFHDA